MTLDQARQLRWPDPIEPIDLGTYPNKLRFYPTPDGRLPSVTNINKADGTGSEALIGWTAKTERENAVEAACRLFASGGSPACSRPELERAIAQGMTAERAKNKAGDIGKSIHDYVHWRLKGLLGLDPGKKPVLGPEAMHASLAWEQWWHQAGLVPLRMEQVLWDPVLGYAGTADLIAWDESGQYGGGLGVWDIKSSKYIYSTHHSQVVAYMNAAEVLSGAVFKHGGICRLPKQAEYPEIEIRMLGDLYDFASKGRRQLSREQCMENFLAALTLHRNLVIPKEA